MNTNGATAHGRPTKMTNQTSPEPGASANHTAQPTNHCTNGQVSTSNTALLTFLIPVWQADRPTDDAKKAAQRKCAVALRVLDGAMKSLGRNTKYYTDEAKAIEKLADPPEK